MSRARRVAALAAVVGALLAGCGGSSTPAASPPAATVPKGLPTVAKLRTALLSERDLPAGWSEIDIQTPTSGICGKTPLQAEPVQKTRASYGVAGAETAILQQGLTAYLPGQAAAAMARLADAATCGRYELTAQDPATGAPATFQVDVADLPVPDVGDERLGWALSIPTRGETTLYGVVREGSTIAVIALTGTAPNRTLFSNLLGTAARRLPKAPA